MQLVEDGEDRAMRSKSRVCEEATPVGDEGFPGDITCV
jgi:hypothetical protein